VARFGAPAACTFHKGWFADTLAHSGSATPLKWVLLTFDGLTALALLGYGLAARSLAKQEEPVR